MKLKDWTNKIYNNCKIIEPVDKDHKNGKNQWKILCSCGKIFYAYPSNLKSLFITGSVLI